MISLIFPPLASPTCIPLGVSFLKAHVEISVTDLNIAYWNFLCNQTQEFSSYRAFMTGSSGLFSRDFYEPLLPVQQKLKLECDGVLTAVRKYLDKNELLNSLENIFIYLNNLIPNSLDEIMFSCLFPDQLTFALGFSKWLKGIRNNQIYLGGASVLVVDPKELLNLAPWVEGIFTGEGEIALEAFINNGCSSSVPGLFKRKEKGEIIEVSPSTPPSMENLEIPDFSWANLRDYFNPEPVLPVQFSRGCKWRKCRFCAHNFSFGKYRCLDPKAAVSMLEAYWKTHNTRFFYVTDQYLDAEFLEPFALELISRNIDIRYTFMGRPYKDMTTELLNLLFKSGCRWISWGVESGNQELLDMANKGTIPRDVSAVLRDSAYAGIKNQALMIFGLPGSNDTAAEETYNFLQENREYIHSHTASEFQLYKGTPFGNNPEKYGLRVTGKVIFCKINGKPLESVKREYVFNIGEDKDTLRGPLEAKKWKRRGVWIYPDNFWNALPSEHYLILCSKEWDKNNPSNPIKGNRVS